MVNISCANILKNISGLLVSLLRPSISISKIQSNSQIFNGLCGGKVNRLTLKDPWISEICIEINIELNFYFRTVVPQKVL